MTNFFIAPSFLIRKSLGTEAQPKGVTGRIEKDSNGNIIRFPEIVGGFNFKAFDGTKTDNRLNFIDTAYISSVLDGEVDTSGDKHVVPGALAFWTSQKSLPKEVLLNLTKQRRNTLS